MQLRVQSAHAICHRRAGHASPAGWSSGGPCWCADHHVDWAHRVSSECSGSDWRATGRLVVSVLRCFIHCTEFLELTFLCVFCIVFARQIFSYNYNNGPSAVAVAISPAVVAGGALALLTVVPTVRDGRPYAVFNAQTQPFAHNLFAVPLDASSPGAAVQLNPTLAVATTVVTASLLYVERTSPAYIVFYAASSTLGRENLFSIPHDAQSSAAAVRLNPEMTSKPQLVTSLRNQAINDTSAPVIFYSGQIPDQSIHLYYVRVTCFSFIGAVFDAFGNC